MPGSTPPRDSAAEVARPIPAPGAALPAALAILAAAATSLHYFYTRGLINLYGDAIAHMEGARRLSDSLTPGWAELGSSWLPLYHLLVAPLAVNDHLWRTGLGGGLVSAAAFAVAAWFVFRLGAEMNRNLAAGWVALAGFLLCANMLAVASTPLTEPLNIMWAVLVVWCLFRYQRSGSLATLAAAGIAAFLGTLTRYDGWFLIPFATLFVLLARERRLRQRIRDAVVFGALAAAGPVLWVLHDWHRYGNPLEFYNGPYSARAIYAHQLLTTGFHYPTEGSLVLSARYYIEDVKLVTGAVSLEIAVLGFAIWAIDARERPRRAAALLFLVPLIFYVQSMASAAVPIYVPTLFPHTYYNLRYGLEMLPAVALFPSFLISARLAHARRRLATAAVIAILAIQFGASVRRGAASIGNVQESLQNTPCRVRSEQSLMDLLRTDYQGGIILTANGKHPCVMPSLDIPYRQTLTELNRRYWDMLLLGRAGWPAGSPPARITWILRGEDDAVDRLMNQYPNLFTGFTLVADYQFPKEDRLRVYRNKK
ncbi:MAG TPA: glycosyltransferase family 39 protein [Terriglobia bacterium]|nr:glycosyltransferase family 39 protein [Terriglobia bacterium]